MYAIRLCGKGNGLTWEVSLLRRCKTYKEQFPFSAWGGKDAALLAAQAWRDEQVRQHQPMPLAERARQVTKANKSGIPGLRCDLRADGSPRAWIARTSIRGVGLFISRFSISTYGEKEAKLLAMAAREQHLMKMTGHMGVHSAAVPPPDVPPAKAPRRPAQAQARRARIEFRLMSNNKSGISGVNCVFGPDGEPRQWLATVGKAGKCFSVKKYGYEEARRLAIEARQALLDEIWPKRVKEK